MNIVFYLSAAVAILSTVLVITRTNAMHALLNLIVSLLAVALMFYTLGAPFVAALEVIVYAGAIMVLFIFAIMLLNQGPQAAALERQWLLEGRSAFSVWAAPVLFSLILIGEVVYVLASHPATPPGGAPVEPRVVGATLFTTYLMGVELASILLLASLVGAFHLGRRHQIAKTLQREEIELTRARELRQPEYSGPSYMPSAGFGEGTGVEKVRDLEKAGEKDLGYEKPDQESDIPSPKTQQRKEG